MWFLIPDRNKIQVHTLISSPEFIGESASIGVMSACLQTNIVRLLASCKTGSITARTELTGEPLHCNGMSIRLNMKCWITFACATHMYLSKWLKKKQWKKYWSQKQVIQTYIAEIRLDSNRLEKSSEVKSNSRVNPPTLRKAKGP